MTRVLDPAINDLRELLLLMGGRSEAILDKAIRAITARDAALAGEVAADDVEIDRLDVQVDESVLKVLALQAPVASDLREVIAIKMIATDLERVGDLARNIADACMQLAGAAAPPFPAAFAKLASSSQDMLNRSLDAFSGCDADLARAVLADDDELDAVEAEVVRNALQQISSHPEQTTAGVDLVLIAKHLERVGDHATNIAEAVILMAEARNVKHANKL